MAHQDATTPVVPPEEDEFEDIEDDNWDGAAVDPAADVAAGAPLWETGWDDDSLDDEFSRALKAVLDKGGGAGGGGGGAQAPPAPPPVQQPPPPHQ